GYRQGAMLDDAFDDAGRAGDAGADAADAATARRARRASAPRLDASAGELSRVMRAAAQQQHLHMLSFLDEVIEAQADLRERLDEVDTRDDDAETRAVARANDAHAAADARIEVRIAAALRQAQAGPAAAAAAAAAALEARLARVEQQLSVVINSIKAGKKTRNKILQRSAALLQRLNPRERQAARISLLQRMFRARRVRRQADARACPGSPPRGVADGAPTPDATAAQAVIHKPPTPEPPTPEPLTPEAPTQPTPRREEPAALPTPPNAAAPSVTPPDTAPPPTPRSTFAEAAGRSDESTASSRMPSPRVPPPRVPSPRYAPVYAAPVAAQSSQSLDSGDDGLDLSDLADDGAVEARLTDLERSLTRRADAVEERCAELLAQQHRNAVAAESDRAQLAEARRAVDGVEGLVVPAARQAALEAAAEAVAAAMAAHAEAQAANAAGCDTHALRRDVDAVTRFADDLQKRAEVALAAANADAARLRRRAAGEAAAQARCTNALHRLRDAAAQARAQDLQARAQDLGDDEGSEEPDFVRELDAAAAAVLQGAALLPPVAAGHAPADRGPLPEPLLEGLAWLAAALDAAIDSHALRRLPFTRQGADFHAQTIAAGDARGKGEAAHGGNEDVDDDGWPDGEHWAAAAARVLEAVVPWLDRHASATRGALATLRLRREFDGLPAASDGTARFTIDGAALPGDGAPGATPPVDAAPDAAADAADDFGRAWRSCEVSSQRARSSTCADLSAPSQLAKLLGGQQETLDQYKDEIRAARGGAAEAGRRVARLDAAISAMVGQMRAGFATREEVAVVAKSVGAVGGLAAAQVDLARRADDAAAEIARLDGHASALADGVNAVEPRYARLEALLATKASGDDVRALWDRVGEPLKDDASSATLTVTKCLACDRPLPGALAPAAGPRHYGAHVTAHAIIREHRGGPLADGSETPGDYNLHLAHLLPHGAKHASPGTRHAPQHALDHFPGPEHGPGHALLGLVVAASHSPERDAAPAHSRRGSGADTEKLPGAETSPGRLAPLSQRRAFPDHRLVDRAPPAKAQKPKVEIYFRS
ncbi:hypothetical protein M885DRAFT_516385, partial [Pelagophyceae sp. CCMP2097]